MYKLNDKKRLITFHKIVQHDFAFSSPDSLTVKKSARMGETSMNDIKPNNQFILDIDFDRTSWNELGRLTFRRFGISKYIQYSIFRNTFQNHVMKKTETTSLGIDGCEFWKIYILSFRNHFISTLHCK